MSQPYPWPYGQSLPATPGFNQKSAGFPGGYGQPAGFPSAPDMPGAVPGMPPLANTEPPADVFGDILPTPPELGVAALLGTGTALAFNQLDRHQIFDKTARLLEKTPGTGYVNNAITGKLEQAVGNLANPDSLWGKDNWLSRGLREASQIHTFKAVEDQRAALAAGTTTQAEVIQRAANESVGRMQKRQLEEVLSTFKTRFTAKPATEATYTHLPGAINLLKPEEWLHEADKATFEHVASAARTQLEHLKAKSVKTAEEKVVQKRLHNLTQRLDGLHQLYLPMYKEQSALSARLQLEGVGPVGRMFSTGMLYLKRIFTGEAMLGGAGHTAATGIAETGLQKLWRTAPGLLMSGFAGTALFMMSIHKANNAKEGEKTRTFFHDFIGIGIGNFIGWEMGRKFLNSFQVANKLLGKHALNTLPRIFGRTIPFLGSLTLGGVATELAAMTIAGSLFQKVAEKFSDAIFGKPSEESLKGKAAAKPPMTWQQQQAALKQYQAQQAKTRSPQAVPKRPDFSIAPTPDQIRRSMALEDHQARTAFIMGQPWDSHNHIDPFDKNHSTQHGI